MKILKTLGLKKWIATDFANNERLMEHYNRHVIKNKEWKNKISVNNYLRRARKLINSKVGGNILGFKSNEGKVYRYNKATNEFGVAYKDGTIATFFKPTNKIIYWKTQVKKYGG